MTKSQKRLDRVHLTEDERKEINKYYRLQTAMDIALVFLFVAAGIIAIICAMEILG